MPARNQDLHGNAPDHTTVALVIIDMINDLEFEGGDALLPQAAIAARNIARLKKKARAAGAAVIYANDNFGRWRGDIAEVVRRCLRKGVRGRPLAQLLAPGAPDYIVLKPKHSAFYATPLHLLLEYLGVKRVILTGVAGDICVLYSAIDAYMRDFRLNVPADCVASESPAHNREALAYMERLLKADLSPADEIELGKPRGKRRPRRPR
jgi:nicotinamidase-related amidase